jgi:dTDP-glucose 4,6-dehydratase
MARILVTGGLGVVGSVLVPTLRRRGHDTWILDLRHSNDPKYIRADVGEYRQLEAAFLGRGWSQGYTAAPHDFDYVYHLAAEFGRWNGEDYYEQMWRSNAVGTKNVLRLQELLGFRTVFFSSSEVYGDYGGVMREEVPDATPIRQMNDYAISKWVNEMQVANSAAMHGTESVVVRLFNTYGPGEEYSPYRSAICLFCYRALSNETLTVYKGHRRTSTYVGDTCETLANIVEKFNPGQLYNIGGLTSHSMEEVAEYIVDTVGRDRSAIQYLDAELFTTIAKEVDCSKAVRDLGHRDSVPLKEGIARTIEWTRERYGL